MAERAVLYDAHEALGAKFTEFSGFEMPLYYSSIVEEHLAVRKAVGLFDVSHMSKVFVEGERAQETMSRSKEYLIFALQGPLAEKTLRKLYNKELPKRFRFIETELEGYGTIISRTGYTGEDGFELITNTKNKELFMKLLDAGKEFGIKPCGLGARDSLRLEKCMPLAGNELEGRTPLEANMDWVIDWEHEFTGKESLTRNVKELLVPIVLEDKGVPRHGYTVKKGEKDIGRVTSGGFSPILEKGIALGYLEKSEAFEGNEVYIDARGKEMKARVIKGAFV